MIVPADADGVRRASEALAAGGLVGMPTETVYGIAADALDERAVAAVFALKERPAENPLIVHVASEAQARSVAAAWPPAAEALARAFWPGPLTIVVPKGAAVPGLVSGGLDSVALRVPAHPAALALLNRFNRPLAAPSANRFTGLSPTRAEDVDPAIAAGLELILDGGPCRVGIESTVVDLCESAPRILRPGAVSRAQLEGLLGELASGEITPGKLAGGEPAARRAPGGYPRHYAPRARMVVVERPEPGACALLFEASEEPGGPMPRRIAMPRSEAAYARKLYAALAELDRAGAAEIQVQAPPLEWEAVWDRLKKASTPKT